MTFREFEPAPQVAPYVERIWTCTPSAGENLDAGCVVPDGCVEVVRIVGGGCVRMPGGGVSTRGLITGIGARALELCYEGRPRLVGFRLRPAAALAIFGEHLAEIRQAPCSLDDRDAPLELRDAGDGAELARMIADVAHNRAQQHSLGARVACAMAVIQRAGGRVRIAEVARAAAISTRHLDRAFDRHLGLTPKTYCRIARFRTAWDASHMSVRPCWAHLALECGYADQAHLCREFRAFSGKSPANA